MADTSIECKKCGGPIDFDGVCETHCEDPTLKKLTVRSKLREERRIREAEQAMLRPIGDDLDPEAYRVHQVEKACKQCGKHWIGNSFSPADGSRYIATCDECLDAEEQADQVRATATDYERFQARHAPADAVLRRMEAARNRPPEEELF